MDARELEAALAALHPVRLPADADGGLFAEMIAAFGIGLLLAAALMPLARWLGSPRRGAAAPPTEAPADPIGLLHALKRDRPARFDALRPDLYRPGGTPSADRIAAMLRGDGPE